MANTGTTATKTTVADANTGAVIAKRDGAVWHDPHGGVFTDGEIAQFDSAARGETLTVLIGRGTKWEKTHFVMVSHITVVTVAPFKSERAAKIAMTKAEKAYTDAMCVAAGAYREAMSMDGVDPIKYADEKRAARQAAWDFGKAVWNQAQAQGFRVRSWHFSDCNPTRDLIAANMD